MEFSAMNAISILLVASTFGVDYGWQQNENGQWEYIVQVEPSLLNSLAEGRTIVSTLPPELEGVRRFVLRVGTSEVPRDHIPEGRLVSNIQTIDNSRSPLL